MLNSIIHGDCIEIMKAIDDGSIDMILCDLPYGITRNKWDIEISLDLLWQQYKRVIKDNGAIVLSGVQPFTTKLIMSNLKLFRYSLIWKKTTATGFLNAKHQPLRAHEDILVFYKKQPTYNPQKTVGHSPVNSYTKSTSDGSNYGNTKMGISGGGSTERYPISVIEFASDKQKLSLHPTQKPVLLYEYLIKTFTNECEVVLDNCIGSGTTAVAALNTGRNFIGIENNSHYVWVANKRLKGFNANK